MNNEIKEILVLQNYVNRYKSDEKAIINHSRLTTPLMLDYLKVKNLLDYITNLQKTNKNHSKKLIELGNKITNLQQENERLKEQLTFDLEWARRCDELLDKMKEIKEGKNVSNNN